MIQYGCKAYALRNLDYREVIGHGNGLGIRIAPTLGGYDFRRSRTYELKLIEVSSTLPEYLG